MFRDFVQGFCLGVLFRVFVQGILPEFRAADRPPKRAVSPSMPRRAKPGEVRVTFMSETAPELAGRSLIRNVRPRGAQRRAGVFIARVFNS